MLSKILKISLLLMLITSSLNAMDFFILYKNETPISSKKICVMFEEEDLKLRQEFELALVQNISRYKYVSAYPSIQLFPPKQTWEVDKINSRLSKMQIESMVKVRFLPKEPEKENEPQKIEISMNKLGESTPMVVLGARGEFLKGNENQVKTFIKEFANGIATILFDEGFIYDCKCGEGYQNLLK